MRGYELEVLLDSLEFSYKNEWEQTRLLSYIIAQSQSTKHLKPTDILSFSWDDNKDDEDEKMTMDDVSRLKDKMNKIIELNKEKQDGRLSNETTIR